METTEILNVTLIEPRLKHPKIFEKFDSLHPGEGFVIHNDHDPKPLYYQLLGERGNIFNWEYLEEGPIWWKVKITKKKSGEKDETLGEIATKDLRKAQIFKKYGLDFCCGGKKTVKEACAEKGLDVAKVEQELQQADKLESNNRPLPYDEWSLDFLADYIVNTHHSYIKKNLPDIRAYADKVKRVHGKEHPELDKIHTLVEATANELLTHMVKEENVLFPFIKELVNKQNGKQELEPVGFRSVVNPINMMEHEHVIVGEYLREVRELTNNYQLPSGACASYGMLYRLLNEFEDDLHLHIHLENNILFKKAVQLEQLLLQ